MRYLSSRGKTPLMTFDQAVLEGLAPDGGLLLPERIPWVGDKLADFADLSYMEFCRIFIRHLCSHDLDLSALIKRAYSTFDTPDVVAFRELEDVTLLELFHGPTLAFKDIALQFLGHLFERLLERSGRALNILGATSGDTGSAAIHAIAGREAMRIFILYPRGRVSRLQEQQMISVRSPNVSCLVVDGSFDDCQYLVKTLFADLDFKQAMSLGAVNSVNWARILAQAVYYGYAAMRSGRGRPIIPVVPTGNFGNIFSGYLAMRMGFPIARLVLATNENDILARFLSSGLYKRGRVQPTESPSMDIQSASNIERLLYYQFDEDGDRVSDFMARFAREGEARLEVREQAHFRDAIMGVRVDREEMRACIRQVYESTGYLVDPHTAIGVAAARKVRSALPSGTPVCLATAHPAKFPETIEQITGEWVTHPRLEAIVQGAGRATGMSVSLDALKAHISARVSAD